MTKGDILKAEKRQDHPHPIVFWEWMDEDRFKAYILSRTSTDNNIPMCEEHFYEKDSKGALYSIKYDNSHLILDSFVKMEFWLETHDAQGKLTEKGVKYIEKQITEEPVLCPAPIWLYIQS